MLICKIRAKACKFNSENSTGLAQGTMARVRRVVYRVL